MYISLDIETTGLDPDNDAIIEVAAVLFDKENIIKKFSKLINPLRPIPIMATHITGITNDDLIDAPTLSEIQQEFEQFVGKHPIIGHNIPFDMGFLRANGFNFPNTEYDTLGLSIMLLDKQASYSLEALTENLGISHKDKHRALDDTIATAELFQLLLNKIDEIPKATLDKIKHYLDMSSHPVAPIFLEAKGSLQKQEAQKAETQKSNKEPIEISKEDLLGVYENQELMGSIYNDYTKRDSQDAMTSAILQAFETPHHQVIEAGTGTGKTAAYLLPAAHKALTQNEKVIIATHTITLQEQVIHKDMPQIEKIIEYLTKGKRRLKSSTLKGRNNYISEQRFHIFTDRQMTADEAFFASKVEVWLLKTKTGDKEELNLTIDEHLFFREISCSEEACEHEKPNFRSQCHLIKARERANTADIVIVNHSLLALDLKIGNLIPQYDYLIIDEAHHLEESFTNAYTHTFTLDISSQLLKEFSKSIAKNIKKLKASLFISESEINQIREAQEKAEQLSQKLEMLFGLIGIFINNFKNPEYDVSSLVISEYARESQEWQKVEQSAKSLSETLEQILENIKKLIHQENNPEFSHQIFDIQKLITLREILKEWSENFKESFISNDQNGLTWVFMGYKEKIYVKHAPINVGKILAEKFYPQKASIILSSATLSTGGNFDFIRNRLYLGEHFEEMSLESHFNYPEQVEIVVPKNTPGPSHQEYANHCNSIIEAAIRKFNGHTLVLFTSQRAIEQSYMALAPKLKEDGFELLGQNMTGGKNKILDKFKHQPDKKAIFGTNTFWEGVDIKGEGIKCVIIQKLPFDPPFDPIHQVRSQSYMNGFAEYALPRAIIRFKQGFGRLIRSENDTGTIIILDNRIHTKEYGKYFIEALPEGINVKEEL